MAEKKNLVIPAEGEFKPAPISGIVAGKGFPNFDGEPDMEYSVAIKLDEEQSKWLQKEILDFFEANKPNGCKLDKPANFDSMFGRDRIFVKTKTFFDDERTKIPVVNHRGVPLDPAEYGNIGEGSMGRVSATMVIYTQGKKCGVSLFLNAVKLTHFEPYAGGGVNAFGAEEGDVDNENPFGNESTSLASEEPKKKKKKKKKKDA